MFLMILQTKKNDKLINISLEKIAKGISIDKNKQNGAI